MEHVHMNWLGLRSRKIMEHIHMKWLGLRNYWLSFGDLGKLPFTNEPVEDEK